MEQGNLIMAEYKFFQHVQGDKPLLYSSSDLYRFDHNLPCQVQRVKSQYGSHWDKVRLLEQHIPCQDRRYLFRIFPNCFVAREAIDIMMELKLVRSRGDQHSHGVQALSQHDSH